MAKPIGIDLGTTYSCVGVWRDEKINIIPNEHGVETTPSVVAFTDSERLIGDAALHQQAQNPGNTVFDIKRLIGRKFDDPKLAEDIKRYPYKVINNGGKPKIEVITMGDTKQFTPEEVSSMILTKLKQSACAYLGHEVKNVVITVPAHFNKSQRQATKNAAIKAGLKVLRILKEPTAAALAYKLDENLNGKRNVLVYDLGGGKFDVTILTIDKGTLFEVQAMAGDMHGDVNNCLVAHLANEFQKKLEKDLRSDMVAMNKLQIAAEQAKKTLSAEANTTIDIKSLFEEIDFHAKITREHFERLCDDLFQSTKQHVRMALADSRLGIEDIHDIVLVGNSTKIPKIQALVQEFFVGQEVHKSIDPEQVVTYGAALQAAVYKRYAKRPGRTQRQRVRRSKMISGEDRENSL